MCREVKFREAERVLLNNGYRLVRIKGSHHYYTNGKNNIVINLRLNRMVWQRLVKENNLEVYV